MILLKKNIYLISKEMKKLFGDLLQLLQILILAKLFLDEKAKMGTIFSLIGDLWGYDITLFNICGENEILLEPERKFILRNQYPKLTELYMLDA